ncbi:MAG: hypothetical protein R3334_09860 [Halomonas venusta]|nr:hypothetical protein [Halomonas venusta]
MSQDFLQQLSELDSELLVALHVELNEFDDEAFNQRLHERAALLQHVVGESKATEQQIQDVIKRSRQLTSLAETVKNKLGEQLKTIHKGRRSQQAYQSIKYQE